MKRFVKISALTVLTACIVSLCGVCGSCASSKGDTMYQTKSKNSKVIKSKYKVRGNNRDNRNTYHAY